MLILRLMLLSGGPGRAGLNTLIFNTLFFSCCLLLQLFSVFTPRLERSLLASE